MQTSESLPNIFEGSVNNEPTLNTMEMLIENDEAIGMHTQTYVNLHPIHNLRFI
jgi:hypothetical protein